MTDTERLDWLEEQGFGSGVISDDAGRWVFPTYGHQPLVADEPLGGMWSFYIEADEWQPSIREAIDLAVKELRGEDE